MPKSTNISTLSSIIEVAIENRLKDLHTSMPGIIESFDSSTQLATVQPAVRRVFITRGGDGPDILIPLDLPIVINVPVYFPRGGGYSLTFPIAKGDECLLQFCERTIDNWHDLGGVRTPTARRMHSLSDAIAFVGVSSKPNKVPNYIDDAVVLGKDDEDHTIVIGPTGISMNTTGTLDITANQINLTSIATVAVTATKLTAATIEATTSLKAASKEIAGHTHIGSPTAPLGVVSPTGANQ